MGLQDIVRWFIPQEMQFYDFLEKQARLAADGAKALAELLNKQADPEKVRDAVQDVEHQGDAVVHAMEEELARTFVTPIDREDLQMLSARLDDVLDLTNGAARAYVLMGMENPSPAMHQLMQKLVEITEVLSTTVPHLRRHAYSELVVECRKLRKIEKDSDAIYREAMRDLFHDPAIDAKTLVRNRQILDDLERAIDFAELAGDTLMQLSIKHG